MTDKDYELGLKDIDCCQNCVHFSLGMHWDGCPKGWCNRGEWKIVNRAAAVCDKYKKRCRMSGLTRENSELEARNADNYSQFIKDIEQEPISEMREIKEGWLWFT